MPKNLEHKIAAVLDDIENLDRADSIRAVKRLVEAEIEYSEADRHLTDWDLTYISSMAADTVRNTSLGSSSKFSTDGSKFRAWCFINAVQAWLRKEGLVKFILKYEDKK